MSPLVSIVIPGYKSKFIKETINSILAQTYKNFEIIVVDDGSPNQLKSVLADLIDAGKIRYIYQENQKMAAARNNGIRNAKGILVAFLDDDDLWSSTKLEEQVALFEDSSVGLVYTFAEGFNGTQRVQIENFEFQKEGSIFSDIFLKDFIANSSVMVRKSCFDEVGLFKVTPDYFGVDDADMWTRITYKYLARAVPKHLTKIRLHDEQFSGDRTIMLNNDLNARKNLMADLVVPTKIRHLYYKRIYFEMAYHGRKTNKLLSAKYYLKSFFAYPSLKVLLAIIKLPMQ